MRAHQERAAAMLGESKEWFNTTLSQVSAKSPMALAIGNKQRFSVLYAAVVLVDDQQGGTSSPSPAPAAPLRPPPEIHHKQDFRVGQRVSFSDQSLKRHVAEIVRLNQRTATVHCDGRAWRVAFALLQHVSDITP